MKFHIEGKGRKRGESLNACDEASAAAAMSYEHVNSLEPGFIKRQLDQVEESIAQWPLWMRREVGLLPPCKHRWNKPDLRFARFCVRCGTKWADVRR